MLLSVVIPTRNRASQLERALDSVASQTLKCYDVTVIDDGSSDQEAAKIREVIERYAGYKLIRNDTSLGAPISRNLGVRECGGDVIAFLDSDDWWEPERLERHASALSEKPSAAISYNPAELVELDGTIVDLCNNSAPDSTKSVLAHIAASNFLGGCSSVCVRKLDFDAVGGFTPSLPSCQDWDLWFRILQRGGQVTFVDQILTKQEVGRSDRITAQRDRALAGHNYVMSQVLAERWSASDLRYINARHFEVQAWIASNFGEYGKAAGSTLFSLLRRPKPGSVATLARYLGRWLISIVMREKL